jgi:hypothetical protein
MCQLNSLSCSGYLRSAFKDAIYKFREERSLTLSELVEKRTGHSSQEHEKFTIHPSVLLKNQLCPLKELFEGMIEVSASAGPKEVIGAIVSGPSKSSSSNPLRWFHLGLVFIIGFAFIIYFREEIYTFSKGEVESETPDQYLSVQ